MQALDKLERERRSLQAIHDRKHWHRWPLERPDGSDAFLDSLNDLSNSPICWGLDEHQFTGLQITELINELETVYYSAVKPWERLRSVRDCPNATYEFLRWPDGTYPAKVQSEAKLRFWELVTTSRFSVNEVPSIRALEEVNFPRAPVTIQHVASLAAMVCIFEAIQALETILERWHDISEPYRGGKPFQWLAEHDTPALERMLQTSLTAPSEIDFYQSQINDSRKARDQANAWLLQVENLQPAIDEIDRKNRLIDVLKTEHNREKILKKAQPRAAAKLPRGNAKNLTVQQVADYWNARPQEKREIMGAEMSELYGVSTRTVYNRLKAAREKNLVQ